MNAKRISKSKMYAAIVTALLFGSIGGIIYFQNKATKLDRVVDAEKVRNEQLYSEKLALEKSIEQMRQEIAKLVGKNADLDKKYRSALAEAEQSKKKIAAMTSENQRAKALVTEVAALRNTHHELENELNRIRKELEGAIADNSRLKSRISELESENKSLASDVRSLNQVAVNNSLVEATKKNERRLTVNAARTKRVKVGFDLPEEMVGNLYFQMLTPSGKTVTSDHSTISISESYDGVEMMASTNGGAGNAVNKKHIDMVYQPETKLEPGIYKIDVYSGSQYLGTTRIHLK
ncbi:MAG: hypothetical protein Kow0075_12960 [Salibacteraceae bacterium]